MPEANAFCETLFTAGICRANFVSHVMVKVS